MRKYVWLLFLVLGFLGFLSVYLLIPHRSEIDHPLQFVYKFIVFIFLCTGIALFPNKNKWTFVLLLAPLAVFVGYLLPRAGYFGFFGLALEKPGEWYTHLYLLMYPMVVMTTAFALRLGGGTPGQVLKTSINAMLIIFSGFLDLMFFVINPLPPPAVFSSAHHIQIFLGHYPAYWEAVVFMIAHIPLIVGVFFLPIDKWFKSLKLIED